MRIVLAAALAAALAAPTLAGEAAVEKSVKALLAVSNVRVEPASPGPETLCELRVEIANQGREAASRFAFEVRLGGQTLPVYEDQLTLQPIAAGESAVIRLHNFWSSETGRPFPADGKLVVEVALVEATWIRVEEKEGAEERTPLGKVEGLPVLLRATLPGPTDPE